MTREEIATRLRAARESLGFTQAEAAEALGMHRPTISEIEAGRRAVTSEELFEFAQLYATSIAELLAEQPAGEEDVLRILYRKGGGLSPAARAAARRFIARCRGEAELEALLDATPAEDLRPSYKLGLPESKWAAVQQGERIAIEERRRLDLGSEPIRNPFDLLETQGVRIGVLEVESALEIDGIFFEAEGIGACIAVNASRDEYTGFRTAFTAAHEYAHWLLRDVQVEEYTFSGGTDDLLEVRANAFAAGFLMPAEGLRHHFHFAGLIESDRLSRLLPGDIVLAMDHFGVSRQALLFRLQNAGLLAAEDAERLRAEEMEPRQVARALGLRLRRDYTQGGRLAQLAIEAWRQGLISTGRASDLMGVDLTDFRRRMNVLGVVQQSADDVPLLGASAVQ